jgi:hypothetical protein
VVSVLKEVGVAAKSDDDEREGGGGVRRMG